MRSIGGKVKPGPGFQPKQLFLPVLVWPARRRFRALVNAADRRLNGWSFLPPGFGACANSVAPRALDFWWIREMHRGELPDGSDSVRRNPWPQGRTGRCGRNRGSEAVESRWDPLKACSVRTAQTSPFLFGG